MDQNRQIRFLIPPFFLLASLFLADFLSCSNIFSKIAALPDKKILAVVAALGASTIPLGFFIGAISILSLHVFSVLVSLIKRERWNYESAISKEACKKIWPQLELESNFRFDLKKRFYIIGTFDHGLFPKGINEWIMRRWNAFNTNFICSVALCLSFPACSFFSIEMTRKWVIITISTMVVLLFNAIKAWWDTMGMIEFQANRNLNKKE